MIRNVDLISYLPEFERNYRELQELLKVQEPEIQGLDDLSEVITDNQFLVSANETGIKKFEAMLKVKPLDDDSLENRIFRMLSLWNNAIPYTEEVLREKLETLCGPGGYTLEILPDNYTVKVRVALISKKNYKMVGELLEEVVPANMVIDLSLLYNQHETLKEFTHMKLASYTHIQLRDEVLNNGN